MSAFGMTEMTAGEILDHFKVGKLSRGEALARIELAIVLAENAARLEMIEKFKEDVAEVFAADKAP